LEQALANLDRLSLPAGVTLEELNATLAEGYSPDVNNAHDDLDDTLLWLEQHLDEPRVTTQTGETAVMPDQELVPSELMLELANLDEAVVDELTADMPDDPDEALTWLMGLTDEIQQPGSEPEMKQYSKQRGARVYDVADVAEETEQAVTQSLTPEIHEEAAIAVQAAAAEFERPQVVPLAADELPEMPDDPDEAIAWIERLAALEEQESGADFPTRLPQSVSDENMTDETQSEQEPADRQARERWLDLLQPPPWVNAKDDS
jgi:hypothetical protein